jgi:hypothetical protein
MKTIEYNLYITAKSNEILCSFSFIVGEEHLIDPLMSVCHIFQLAPTEAASCEMENPWHFLNGRRDHRDLTFSEFFCPRRFYPRVCLSVLFTPGLLLDVPLPLGALPTKLCRFATRLDSVVLAQPWLTLEMFWYQSVASFSQYRAAICL